MAAALAVIMRHINSSTQLGGVGVENHTELSITASWEEWGGAEAWSLTGERPRFLTGSLRASQGGGGARTLSAPAFAG